MISNIFRLDIFLSIYLPIYLFINLKTMNKKFSLLLGAIFILGVGFLIYSCSKDDESSNTAVPSDLLTTVKNWHTAQTQISGTLNISKGKKPYVLPPQWNEARLQQQSNSKSVIIVPSPDAGIDPTSTRGLVRKFVFTVQNGKVTTGRIIEMFSSKDSIENSKYTLIEDYANGIFNKFDGGLISYDVNYKRLSSEVYKKGVKASNQRAKVSGMSIESFNKKFGTTGKTRLGSAITTLDDCYYLVYYEYQTYWPYNIVYWEIIGEYCSPNDNEAGGGGGPGSGGGDGSNEGGGTPLYDQITSANSTLDALQKQLVEDAATEFINKNSIYNYMWVYLVSNQVSIKFSIYNTGYPAAAYSEGIYLRSNEDITYTYLREEFIHKFQMCYYGSAYNPLVKNAEFEAKVLQAINIMKNDEYFAPGSFPGTSGLSQENGLSYWDWVIAISQGASFNIQTFNYYIQNWNYPEPPGNYYDPNYYPEILVDYFGYK
jgi:hypothetical protein